jgi:lipopolysaccharide transport system ATP-binding protein
MSFNAVECNQIFKSFVLYPSPWYRIVDVILGSTGYHGEIKPILKDINFSIKKGESVGIVGTNGSGKSTLLKIISGVLKPTSGTVATNGRIASLLELGTGFHGEFTGRQNLILNAKMMGISQDQMEEKIAKIIEFSGLGDYIDQKVRTYSSGMFLRLGFSLTTHVDADILVVDEALAVGDALFQSKCIKKIRSWVHNDGKTLLYVSHDPSTVKLLCNRGILIEKGKIIGDGAPDVVLDHYNALIGGESTLDPKSIELAYQNQRGMESGNGKVRLSRSRLLGLDLQNKWTEKKLFLSGEAFRLVVELDCLDPDVDSPTLGFHIRDVRGYDIFGTNTHLLGFQTVKNESKSKLLVAFEGTLSLGRGMYSLGIAVHEGKEHTEVNHLWIDKLLHFEVANHPDYLFDGVARIQGHFNSGEG